MGYVHDTQMSMFIRPNQAMKSAGTWTEKETATADVWCIERTAADAVFNVHIPIILPSNAAASKGCYLKTIDVWFIVLVGALDSLAATIYKTTQQADTAALVAGVAQTFTYDTGHDAAAERITVANHKMTLPSPPAAHTVSENARTGPRLPRPIPKSRRPVRSAYCPAS